MKLFLSAITFLLVPVSLAALPLSNPSEPANYFSNTFHTNALRYGDPSGNLYNFRVGYYGDFVFNRHLKVSQSSNDTHFTSAKIATNAASLTLNFLQTFDLFLALGTSDFSLIGSGQSFSPSVGPGFMTFLNTTTDFSWNLGVRSVFYVFGNTVLGGSLQYFSANPHIEDVGHLLARAAPSSSTTFRYREVQGGIGVSHLFAFAGSPISLIPYLGVKVAGVYINTPRTGLVPTGGVLITLPGSIRNSRLFGYALGTTLRVYGNLGITVEGQWADENAISVTGQLRY